LSFFISVFLDRQSKENLRLMVLQIGQTVQNLIQAEQTPAIPSQQRKTLQFLARQRKTLPGYTKPYQKAHNAHT